MNVILCSREEESRTLSHGLVLCTPEEAEEYLMHYRTKGSKNGVRRWQYEDGSLTPEGYIHYGVGQGNRHARKAEKLEKKTEKAQMKYDKALTSYHGMFGKWRSSPEKIAKRKTQLEVAQAKQRIEEEKAKKQEEKGQKRIEKDKTKEENGSNKVIDSLLTGDSKKVAAEVEAAIAKAEKEGKFEQLDEHTKYADLTKAGSSKDKTNEAHNKYKDSAGEEFNGNKEHDDAIRDTSIESIKKRIEDDNEYYRNNYDSADDPNIRSKTLLYLTTKTNKLSSHNGLGMKNFGDDLLLYLHETDKDINSKINPGGKWDSKAYKELQSDEEYKNCTELRTWLIHKVENVSGSWNAGEFKKGSRADKAYHAYADVRDKIGNLYDRVSKETGYTFGKNYDKLIKAVKKADEWPALDKAYQKGESDLLGAMLRDIGFRDTPENRYLLTQYAFID